jgi:hypothetical protein
VLNLIESELLDGDKVIANVNRFIFKDWKREENPIDNLDWNLEGLEQEKK